MRTNRERLIEVLEDLILEDRSPYAIAYTGTADLISEYADRIMADINQGIIQAERPGQ